MLTVNILNIYIEKTKVCTQYQITFYKNKIKLVYFSKHSTGVYWTGVSRSLRFNYETGCKLRK